MSTHFQVLNKGPQKEFKELTVQIWDFAGQKDYYVTHKVFLSPSALYLLIFDLRLQKEGIDGLRVWISDIQVGVLLLVSNVLKTFSPLLKKLESEAFNLDTRQMLYLLCVCVCVYVCVHMFVCIRK